MGPRRTAVENDGSECDAKVVASKRTSLRDSFEQGSLLKEREREKQKNKKPRSS